MDRRAGHQCPRVFPLSSRSDPRMRLSDVTLRCRSGPSTKGATAAMELKVRQWGRFLSGPLETGGAGKRGVSDAHELQPGSSTDQPLHEGQGPNRRADEGFMATNGSVGGERCDFGRTIINNQCKLGWPTFEAATVDFSEPRPSKKARSPFKNVTLSNPDERSATPKPIMTRHHRKSRCPTFRMTGDG
jgi:hypothetical protein